MLSLRAHVDVSIPKTNEENGALNGTFPQYFESLTPSEKRAVSLRKLLTFGTQLLTHSLNGVTSIIFAAVL